MARKTPRERYLLQFGLDLSLQHRRRLGLRVARPEHREACRRGLVTRHKARGRARGRPGHQGARVWQIISKERMVGETRSLPKSGE